MPENDKYYELSKQLKHVLGDFAEDVAQIYNNLYDWMIKEGRNPRRKIGIKEPTAENYLPRLDQLHRFVIDTFDPEDPTVIEDDQADEVLLMIDRGEITKYQSSTGGEYSESSKRKFANALQIYFKWRYYEGSMDYVWEPQIDFSDGKGKSAYRFTYHELGWLFEAAETYGSLPSYYETPEEERERINGLVAQRLGLRKEEVSREDWLEADWSSKIHSLIAVGYDAGLTPVEIANAEVHWYDPKTKTFEIPTEYACKDREEEKVGLSDKTAKALSEWLQEQRHLSKYDGSSKIWLNRDGNPYQSGSLCNLIRNLCEEAGIKTEGRKIVWYSLRQTMGRNVSDEGEVAEANDQLRHENLETTHEIYNRTPVEKLQVRLNATREKAEKAAADPEYNPYEEEDHDEVSVSEPKGRGLNVAKAQRESQNALKRTNGGAIHADVIISDTPDARSDLATRILNEEPDE